MSAKHKMATRRECLQLGLRDKMSTRRTKSRFRTGHRDWNLLSDSTAAQHVSTGEAEGGRGGADPAGRWLRQEDNEQSLNSHCQMNGIRPAGICCDMMVQVPPLSLSLSLSQYSTHKILSQ